MTLLNNQCNNKNDKLKAVVFGGTGSVGKSLIDYMLTISNRWDTITIVSRRQIDRWDKYCKKNSNKKLNFLIIENFNILKKSKDELIKENMNFSDYDSMFNCLGYDGEDKDKLLKLDYELVIDIAELCIKFNINTFSNVSSWYSHPYSSNSYFKIKSYSELKLYEYQNKIKFIKVYKPGCIINRHSVGSGSYIQDILTKLNMLLSLGLIPYCDVNELGCVIGYESESLLTDKNKKQGLSVYNTNDIIEIYKNM